MQVADEQSLLNEPDSGDHHTPRERERHEPDGPFCAQRHEGDHPQREDEQDTAHAVQVDECIPVAGPERDAEGDLDRRKDAEDDEGNPDGRHDLSLDSVYSETILTVKRNQTLVYR